MSTQPFRLLVPVDFSPEQESIYNFLAYLSREREIEVTFFHVVQTPTLPASLNPAVDFYTEMVAEVKAAAAERMEHLKTDNRFSRCALNTHFSTDVEGPVALQVAEYAKAEKYDLILASSKHRTGVERLLIGTELLSLLRLSHTPVLCLSEGPLTAIQRIVFATDLSPESNRVLPQVLRLAELLGAGVQLACITTPSTFISSRQFQERVRHMRTQLETTGLHADARMREPSLYNDASIVDGILHASEDHLADLLVMATHARRGLSRLMTGSITEAVLEETHLPLLVFRLPEGN